jgi:tetratricopeptide (TPR) repeat protein
MPADVQVRRNQPCPCGSGRRYKECHGRLASQEGGDDALHATLSRALAAHRQGRIDEAEAAYRAVLERHAGHPVATHYLGLAAWQRGDVAEAERRMLSALEADASIPDFHNNLGLLLRDTGRAAQAVERFRSALETDPRYLEARNNLGLALEAAGRFDEAAAAYREAIAMQPAFAAARHNLARVLLALGRYAEGWREYRWRLLAQGLAASAPLDADAPLPGTLAGRRFALRSEQGIGDVLFFLRFAPELARRGATLAFRGDARLHAMLDRTGLFALGMGGADDACDAEPIAIGDLPWLLEASEPGRFPRPLPLMPLPQRVSRWRERLAAAGPHPWMSLTWRSGIPSVGPSRTQVKEVEPSALGRALGAVRATWLGIQRHPREGEHERISSALGSPLHDSSVANDDLEDMLALLSLVDGYVCVSNTNTHLAASLGRPLHVLVANPAEWRWELGDASPWFPGARLYRQATDGDWGSALARLAAELAA